MKKSKLLIVLSFLLIAISACKKEDDSVTPDPPVIIEEDPVLEFYTGADLSYVNEMVDCGAVYFNETGNPQNPYSIFADAGTDLVRVRLWHHADWTDYSDFEDVKKTIASAKANKMQVLLDFHYSDDWADPGKQKVPAAWLSVVNNTPVLGDSLYNYTYQVLSDLHAADLMPQFVQIGNEINSEILQDPDGSYSTINWSRNVALLNKGINAVKDASTDFNSSIQTMIHIAQPENALWWFKEAKENGIGNFDWIGLSYYPAWSTYTLGSLPSAITTLKSTYKKRLMIVETAYPYTLENKDAANNILGNDALVAGYPATQQGQYDFLVALVNSIMSADAEGFIYWEPAWVSTNCSTQWAQGSHWDNATLFDHDNKVNLGMKIYK